MPALLTAFLLVHQRASSAVAPQSVLVELFTSEGCSSCPPADRLLMELDRNRPISSARVIVLSEHVDYWNSLGWRDPFSSAQWTERQSDYGRRFGLDSVYTPQIVVDGSRQVVGSDSLAVRRAIQSAAEIPHLSIRITDVSRSEERLPFTYSADAAPNTTLYAVVADDFDRSSVDRGENAGRTLDHVAVARSLVEVASLGSAVVGKTAEIKLPFSDTARRLRFILFAQNSRTGVVVGVAEREL